MNVWMELARIIGPVTGIISIEATADLNHDGKVDAEERTKATLRELPLLGSILKAQVKDNPKLDTPEKQAACAESLIEWAKEWGFQK